MWDLIIRKTKPALRTGNPNMFDEQIEIICFNCVKSFFFCLVMNLFDCGITCDIIF